jgi:high-affinity nickel permease
MSTKPSLREHLKFSRDEIPSLIGVLSVVIFLHVAGWGLFFHYNSNPAYSSLTNSSGALIYAGAGALAYSFGLRHAFDADHIAAIDDTTRLMLAKGKKPLAVGLFFSLGHSTIVMALCIGVAFAAKQAAKFQKDFAETGGIIGAYSPISWGLNSGYIYNMETFLFDNNNKYTTAQSSWGPGQYAIYQGSNYGPTFGGSHDIYVCDNSNSNKNSLARK